MEKKRSRKRKSGETRSGCGLSACDQSELEDRCSVLNKSYHKSNVSQRVLELGAIDIAVICKYKCTSKIIECI